MIICPDKSRHNPVELSSLIQQYQINIWESTPALIMPVMRYFIENALDTTYVKVLILGSDSCALKDYRELTECLSDHTRVINSYGTTETTIDSCYFEARKYTFETITATTPIGKPYDNSILYVLDDYLNLVPEGIKGELLSLIHI